MGFGMEQCGVEPIMSFDMLLGKNGATGCNPADQRQTYEEWAAEKIKTIVPLGQWQQPTDIANMVVFLSSDKAAHVTGQTINVDGGYVMHW